MRTLIVVIFGLLISSCETYDAKIYPGLIGQKIVGNKNYVTISNVWNEMDALPLAEGHCVRFKRSALFDKMEGNRAIFKCISN